MTRFALPLTLFVLSCFTGCVSMGPWTVACDRFDYAAVISESWKSQTLLNLVLFTLVEPATKEEAPIVTIPIG